MSGIRKAGIVTNLNRDPDYTKTKRVAEMLTISGIEVVLPNIGASSPSGILSDDNIFKQANIIITLGGDGTILSVAERAAISGIPVMGINIGNLGYLTDCSFEDAEASIRKLVAGAYERQKRMMLKAQVSSERSQLPPMRCLNDVCITRGALAKIIRFDLLINGDFVDNYNADGIIISTPTGSTAYNLSAGGPILIPSSEMITITPICPHTLTTRPIVVTSDDRITLRTGTTTKETVITLDGRDPIMLHNGDVINVRKAERCVEIIKTNDYNFYDILRQKLISAGTVDL